MRSRYYEDQGVDPFWLSTPSEIKQIHRIEDASFEREVDREIKKQNERKTDDLPEQK